jgi:hypothetical protein
VVTIIFLLATCCMAGRLTLYILTMGHQLSSYCGHYHLPSGHLLHGRQVNPIYCTSLLRPSALIILWSLSSSYWPPAAWQAG